MSAPLPKDPLDDLIAEFVTAVNEFLAFKAADVDPPMPPTKTQNPIEDIKRSWEELGSGNSASATRCSWVLYQKSTNGWQKIVSVGSEVIALTDDRHIVCPIEDLVRMATEQP